MVEIRQSFSSSAEWRKFRDALPQSGDVGKTVVEDVRARGYEEPLTGERRGPDEILIRPENLHESISSHQLNSRKRALLLQIQNELEARRWLERKDLRILSADGLSRLALILRGRYPFFHGGEYLPTQEARERFFPVPHLDLHAIDFPDGRFDLFICGDVFEHLPFLNQALREIFRILNPGGALVSSFPFQATQERTRRLASLSPDGEIVHHEPPQYHGNPVDAQGGSLVFQLPGWDILADLKDIGFADAYFTMIASSRYGVANNGQPGPFILTAVKPGGGERAPRRPPGFVNPAA